MKPTVTIREADIRDTAAMAGAAYAMAAESEYSDLSVSYRKLRHVIDTTLNPLVPDLKGFVAEVDGVITGGMIVRTGEMLFNDDLVVSDVGLYVAPGQRGLGIGRRLRAAVEAWAVRQGAKHIYLGSTADINTDYVRKAYEADGYKTVGHNFRKRL